MINRLLQTSEPDVKQRMEELLNEKEIVLNFDEQIVFDQLETLGMFSEMFAGSFQNTGSNYNAFIKAMLHGNIKEMNAYMNEVASTCICIGI